MIHHKARIIGKSKTVSILGEGIAVESISDQVCWVDIIGGRVVLTNREMTEEKIFDGFKYPSKAFFDIDGRLLILHQRGIALYDSSKDGFNDHYMWPYQMSDERFNDAAIMDDGTFWITTMKTENQLNEGKLWRWTPGSAPEIVVSKIGIPNSIAYDSKFHRLFYCDSVTREIRYLPLQREISKNSSQKFSDVDLGVPDGSTVDYFGRLWNCRWDASKIIVFDHTGNVIRSIELPVRRPTSCFLDTKNETLMVTSALAETSPYDGRTTIYALDDFF